MQTKVFFSEIKQEIIRNLKTANQNIKVAVAWLTDEDIIRALTQKSESGVSVQVVISDSKENFKNISKLRTFLRFQGKLYVTSPKFLHNKFCIIDDNTIINGSYNWTYRAQSSEENILVISIDKNIKEETDLITKFNIKYDYFCNKISKLTTSSELDDFKTIGKDASLMFAQLEESEIKLRQELEDAVKVSFDKAMALNIHISPLLLDRMRADGGGVDFIKRILHDEMSYGEMKSGFNKLAECIPHRVDLSLEYLASRPKFEKLFRTDEVEFCKKLMTKYNL